MTTPLTSSSSRFPWKYLIAGTAILILAYVGYTAFNSSSVEYTDLAKAEQLGKTVQIVGTWVKEQGSSYNAASNTFTFTIKDENGKEIPVELTGAKPNNFEIAISVVAKGRVENGVFRASSVLTKCPSKYEGKPADAMPKS
ncbi:MAG: cytochrome c maturation protein CcmE [Candidatus Kapabacteria bacterium]|nr:cytochrome c maturation protein CcmE [Candidatus Kapabacteria bacterium]